MTAVNRRAVLVAGAALLAVGGVGGRWQLARSRSAARPSASAQTTTAAVVRTDVIAREQVPGTLGYAGAWPIAHAGPPGVLTGAPAPATIVERGQRIYEVDGRPVFLLYGARPAWREFGSGMPPGADVRQLEENLAALGYGGSTVDSRFTTSTATAVRRWQSHTGVPRTGRLALGTVVFAPEAIRVVETLVPAGSRVGDGPLLDVSSTRRVVLVALPTSRQGQVQPRAGVEVTLPGGERVPGTVTEVGRVAVSGETGPGAGATITVTVTLDRPDAAGGLDQAPVQVAVTTAERRGVLAVPVTALLAGAAGGYEVVVTNGGTRSLHAVRPGLLDERAGLIEVTGDGLAEGMRVEVPQR